MYLPTFHKVKLERGSFILRRIGTAGPALGLWSIGSLVI